MNIPALAIGALAVAVNLTIYWQNERKRLLLTKLSADLLWTLHYCLLGAFSGAAIALIGVVRSCVFLNENKRWASGRKWLIVFLVLSILSAGFTYKNAASLLPMCASLLAVLSFWQRKPSLTRFLAFPISVSMLIYDIFAGSSVGIINEAVVLISSLAAVIRFRKETNAEPK